MNADTWLGVIAQASSVVVRTVPVPGAVAAGELLGLLELADIRPRYCFEDGDLGHGLCGVGTALCLEAESIEAAAEKLALLAPRLDPSVASSPWLGGFAFDPSDRADWCNEPLDLWPGFSPVSFVLPSVTLVVDRLGSRVLLAGRDPDELAQRGSRLAILLQRRKVRSIGWQQHLQRLPFETRPSDAERCELQERLARAIDAVQRGTVEKVVVATARSVESSQPIAPQDAFHALAQAAPQCTRFLIEPSTAASFVGATPERLVSRRGSRVQTLALAGSAPRSKDLERDADLGRALLEDAKERAEHRIVVEDIASALSAVGARVEVPQGPELRTLSTLQHLATPINATLTAPASILQLAAALHPTPALAGRPRAAAMAMIKEIEPADRGWFGGAVGWIDAHGDGDLHVAIRALRLKGRIATAFAGAGLVEGSDPGREADEIEMKLDAALEPLRFAAFGAISDAVGDRSSFIGADALCGDDSDAIASDVVSPTIPSDGEPPR